MKKELSSEKLDLTGQECSILRLIAAGQSTKKIAASLGLQPTTVMWYRKRLHIKFEVHNMAELIAKASELDIL